MSDVSTNLALPYLAAAQAQKHVTVNESLLRLDAIVQLAVLSETTSAQPGAPADGSVYIVPSGKTGTHWAPMANWALAYFRDGAWEEITPREGFIAYVKDTDVVKVYSGSAWSALAGGGHTFAASDKVLGRVSSGGGAAEEVTFTDQAQQLCDDTSFSAMRTTLGAAADTAVVHNTGAESVAGAKTFTDLLTVNSNAGAVPALPSGTLASFAAADAAAANVFFDTFAAVPQFNFRRANGTNASKSALASGDIMGGFACRGYGATDYSSANRGFIGFVAAEAWSDTAQGSRLSLRTTANGAASAGTERFGVEQDGALTIRNGAQVLTDANGLVGLRSYTVAGLPSAGVAARLIYVSNESGGAVVAFSDGTNWRRVTDRAVVS